MVHEWDQTIGSESVNMWLDFYVTKTEIGYKFLVELRTNGRSPDVEPFIVNSSNLFKKLLKESKVMSIAGVFQQEQPGEGFES